MNVDKKIKHLLQKHYRQMDTNFRRAMDRWNRTKGQEARRRYAESPAGQEYAELKKARNSKGGDYYEQVMEEHRKSRASATRSRKLWTGNEEQKLIYLVDAGLTNKMIGKIMGRSIKAVGQKRLKMGVLA